MKKTAQELFDEAFNKPRDPRSAEYKAGVLALLIRKLGDPAKLHCPYPAGSAQNDAWYSGNYEGHAIYQKYLDEQREAK